MADKAPLIRLETRDGHRRLHWLQVPMDLVPMDKVDEIVLRLINAPGSNQVVFLRVGDFMRALRNPEYRACLQKASLVIPVSRSLQTATAKLGIQGLQRYAPFDFVVRILHLIDQKGGSFYLLGDRPAGLATTEKNLRWTFPKAQALGRFTGYYAPAMEKNIMKAISKASPNFLLLGPGPKGGDLWIRRRRSTFQRGIQVSSNECYEYFSLRQKRANRVAFAKGRDYFHEIGLKPSRIFLFPMYLMFRLTLLFSRLAKKGIVTC